MQHRGDKSRSTDLAVIVLLQMTDMTFIEFREGTKFTHQSCSPSVNPLLFDSESLKKKVMLMKIR